jgi:hypothetical protein
VLAERTNRDPARRSAPTAHDQAETKGFVVAPPVAAPAVAWRASPDPCGDPPHLCSGVISEAVSGAQQDQTSDDIRVVGRDLPGDAATCREADQVDRRIEAAARRISTLSIAPLVMLVPGCASISVAIVHQRPG